MSGLRSDLFRGDSALLAALTVDAGHVVKGARGSHVRKLQAALTLLLDAPPSNISDGEMAAGLYGDTTADAVLRFKTDNNIINTAYQTTPDNITGKMTMRALDDAMAGVEAELAADILRHLARLEQLLASEQVTLPPAQRARFDALRVTVLSLLAPGGLPNGRFDRDFRRGVAYLDTIPRGRRPPIVFAAAPLVAVGAGAAIIAFLIAIAVVIALVLLVDLVIESGKLGNRVSQAIEEALAAGEEAVIGNVSLVNDLTEAVDHCKAISKNGNPACLAALLKFAAKRLVVVAKRNELHSILNDLRDSLKGSPKKLVWKILAKRAEAAGKALAKEESELIDIAREIIKECGCRFIRA